MNRLRSLWQSCEDRPGAWLLGVLGLAALLRAALFALEGIGDEEPRTLEIARTLAAGGGLSLCNQYFPFCAPGDPTAQVGPLPALLFAGLVRLTPSFAVEAIVWIQQFLGIATTGLVCGIAWRLLDRRRAAVLAGLACATYPHLARLELYPREETLFAALTCLGVLLAVVAARGERRSLWLLTGAALGAASLCRAALVYFPPILAVAALWIAPGSARRRGAAAALLLLGFALVLTPWIARNYAAFDAFVPGGSLTGYNLYRHNHILTGDDYLRYVRGDEAERALDELLARRPDLRGDEDEPRMDRVYREEALAIIRAHPLRYAHLSLYRAVPLLTDRGVNPTPLPTFWQIVNLENLALVLLAGWAVARRVPALVHGRERVFLILVLLLGYYTAGHMLANAKLRYAVPVLPLFMVLAADPLARLCDRVLGYEGDGAQPTGGAPR